MVMLKAQTPIAQEIGYVTLSHGMSLVITLTKDWSSPYIVSF
jgi:hypothetical protein